MKVIVHDIGYQRILSDAGYLWLLNNLGKELPVSSVLCDRDGNISVITIFGEGPELLCLFSSNLAVVELIGLPKTGKFMIGVQHEGNNSQHW